MKVLVTGGGGFLGFHIVKLLLARGDEITVLGRNIYPKVVELGVKSIAVDICDYQQLEAHFKGFEEVFHVAAVADIWGEWKHFYTINYVGTQNVVRACLANCVKRLIYTSSPSVVFDGTSQKNLDESAPYSKKWLAHYPRSKMLAENCVLGANSEKLKTVALRPHLIWGPGDPHIFPRIVAKAKKGQLAIVGDAQNLVDIIYVENAARGHVLAANALRETGVPAGKPYFLGQNEPVNLWGFVEKILHREGIAPPTKQLPFFVVYALAVFAEFFYRTLKIQSPPPMTRFMACQLGTDHYYSHKNAAQDFGYSADISIEEGLNRIYGSLDGEVL